ncbi:hypothetical protein CROQUDRAFT_92843 [Cronartium quercuum f. sp. fusiforme G11]|uniref:Uncharacterized protein n=1 Tax=Cronartium quercuum f. sp. fusiforme G11 TaxID=708437 RepID=A0A9P6NGB2_9BASI|nr:hypothetical protein CROQUDRAFT_92843 [Cronartium quercuum f. sp. fusiforme G11]
MELAIKRVKGELTNLITSLQLKPKPGVNKMIQNGILDHHQQKQQPPPPPSQSFTRAYSQPPPLQHSNLCSSGYSASFSASSSV